MIVGTAALIGIPTPAQAWPPNTGCSYYRQNFAAIAECDSGLYEYRVQVRVNNCAGGASWWIYGPWKSSPNVSVKVNGDNCVTGLGIQYGAYGR